MKRSRDDGPGSSAVVKRCARETRPLELELERLSSSRTGARIDAREKQTARKLRARSSGRVGAEFPTDRPRPDGAGAGPTDGDGDRWIDGS